MPISVQHLYADGQVFFDDGDSTSDGLGGRLVSVTGYLGRSGGETVREEEDSSELEKIGLSTAKGIQPQRRK